MRIYKLTISLVAAIIFTFSFNAIAFGQRQYMQAPRQTPAAPKRIQWESNLYAAYQQALKQNKPMVVYFYVWNGENCRKMENGPLASREINSLADIAIFARVDVETEDAYKNVAKLLTSLKIDRYPTVAVLDAYKDKIVERGHVTGYYETSPLYYNLTQFLFKK